MKKEKNGFSLKTLSATLVSLGCDKNRVDAEKMLYKLTQMGFKISTSVHEADLIIINTCAFIQSAIEESERTIKETFTIKKPKAKIIVTGCYAQRFYDKAKELFPYTDLILKLNQNETLEEYVYKLYNQEKQELPCNKLDRLVSTPRHYAYLKISDGCNNFCTYCTIPFIRGRYRSEKMEDLLEQVKVLAENGTKEIILIAQDVTSYGKDLYNEPKLVELIQEISKISGIECIRLHYCYPELVDDRLIQEIVNNPKVAKYIDIPLQHISDKILKAMNRKGDSKLIYDLLKKLKENNIVVRSTFIVGFPTETEKEFKELVNFLKSEELKYVGFFAYSCEENTKASKMEQVPEKVKQQRLKKIQKVQTKILNKIQKAEKGKIVKAICDGHVKDGVYMFRDVNSSPEVDTVIYAYSKERLRLGEFCNIKIRKQIGIDLEGDIQK